MPLSLVTDTDAVPARQALNSAPLRDTSPLIEDDNRMTRQPTSYDLEIVPLLHHLETITR